MRKVSDNKHQKRQDTRGQSNVMSLFGNNPTFICAVLVPLSCLCHGRWKLKHPDRLYTMYVYMYVCIRGGPKKRLLHHDLWRSIVLYYIPMLLYHFNWRKELTSTVIQINDSLFYTHPYFKYHKNSNIQDVLKLISHTLVLQKVLLSKITLTQH
jgi:hypothetical protein